jgi:predicted amidohydrolase YtcJ
VAETARSLALTNADIVTPGRARSRGALGGLARAGAMLIRGGVIEAVGSEDEVRTKATSGTEFRDIGGRTVVPGFIDAHIHPIFYGLSLAGVPCLPPRVSSIEDLRREVAKRVSRTPDGQWVWGQGYDDTRLKERRHPTRDDLDGVSPERPVVLTRVCGHMRVANSRALELGGVDARTPDPPGGRIDRDVAGRPTGLLLETAEELVLRHVVHERADIVRALRPVSEDLLRHGIIACCDAWFGYSHGPAERDIWVDAIESNVFLPAISFLVHHRIWRESPDLFDPTGPLNILGVKIVSDGSISGGSAAISEPFLEKEDHRLLVGTPDELSELCEEIASRGLAVAIHAMGDRAITMAIDALPGSRAAADAGSLEPGHRIEHCTLPRPSDIARMARLGIAAVMQPIFLFAEGEAYLAKLGAERSRWANPARALIDAGVRVALSSDAPATTWGEPTDVMLGIHTSVARRTWAGSTLGTEQSTTVEEALVGYTASAARAAGFGRTRGSIEVGVRADLAVLSANPLETAAEAIQDVDVTATMLAGEVVFGQL